MTDEATKATAPAGKSEAEKPAKEADETFTVERLIADARGLVGSPPHVVAGALRDRTGSMTCKEAARLTREFLVRPVN